MTLIEDRTGRGAPDGAISVSLPGGRESESRDGSSDRFRGAMLGTACGDALGMPWEFSTPAEILAHLPRPTTAAAREAWARDFRGVWTDDTLMTLCHARSLVRTGTFDPEDTAREFIAWVETRDLRGIGFTCHGAIRKLQRGVPWTRSGKTGEFAAGNGAAMKIAPLGLRFADDLVGLHDLCRTATLITHNCDEAFAGARAVAFAVALAVRGELDPGTLIDRTVAYIGPSRTSQRLERAGTLLAAGASPAEALFALKCGGYVVETVGAAFFCFLKNPDDPEKTLIDAVLGGFDADTTGAVAGAITGAYNGASALPAAWIDRLENAAGIRDLADELHRSQRG